MTTSNTNTNAGTASVARVATTTSIDQALIELLTRSGISGGEQLVYFNWCFIYDLRRRGSAAATMLLRVFENTLTPHERLELSQLTEEQHARFARYSGGTEVVGAYNELDRFRMRLLEIQAVLEAERDDVLGMAKLSV